MEMFLLMILDWVFCFLRRG